MNLQRATTTSAPAVSKPAASALRLSSVGLIVGGWLMLLGAVAWVRFGLSSGWPTAEDSQRPWWSGYLSMSAIVLAAVAAGLALRRARRDPAAPTRPLMAMASLLVVASLSLHGYEVIALWRGNFIGRLDVHARANLSYLAAVSKQLASHRAPGRQPSAEQRALVERLQQDLVGWTERVVVASERVEFQRAALRTLAYDVLPRSADRVAVEQHLLDEATMIERELAAASAERREMRQRAGVVSAELERLNALQPSASGLESTTERASRDAATELTELEIRLQKLRDDIQRLESRQQLRQELGQLPAGLGARYPWLELPVRVPGGAWWSWSYVGVTAAYALHALGGLAIALGWRTSPRGALLNKLAFLELYWGVAAVGYVAQWWLLQAVSVP